MHPETDGRIRKGESLHKLPVIYMVMNFMNEILFSVLTSDRVGLSRSARHPPRLCDVPCSENVHLRSNPRRLNWTGLGLQVYTVEEYMEFSALLHVAAALKRASVSR